MSDVESAKYWLSWIEFGSTIALLLVALGVGFEFVADRVAAPLRRKIEMAREAEISQANARAEEAKRDATIANLELTRIERRFAPRRLSGEERERIVAKLAEFAPRAVTIVEARFDDPEEKDFVIDLVHVFKDAHWQSTVTTDPQHISRTMSGLLVMINEDETVTNSQLSSAANCLINALLTENIFIQGPLSTRRFFKDPLDPPIMVIVGAKPDFPKEND